MTQTGQIVLSANATDRIRHAGADLQRYLTMATGTCPTLVSATSLPTAGLRFVIGFLGDKALGDALIVDGAVSVESHSDGYSLRRVDELIAIVGADEAGVVFGVYALLEEAYGCGFFLGSEVVPAGSQPLLPDALDLQRAPAFSTRGLLPWYDFLSGPTAWNLNEYKLYFDRMVRMGLNFIGLHVYSTGSVNRSGGAEPFLSFSYRGINHDAYLDTTQTARWGYQPMRTSEFVYGTDQVFAGETFGADVAVEATGPLDAADRGKALLREALAYAKERGFRICLGFEPAAVPEEILNALPPNAKRPLRGRDGATQHVLDLTTVVAKDILRLRLDDLLETYPMVDAIWLWQNEDAAWTTQHSAADILPFDSSYLRVAHDYLNERAPEVNLVVSGWGAVHTLFDQLNAELPKDVTFSALHHNLGTTPTDEVYGRLDGRDRWPIPWLEDDATLWQPQYHVERFQNDIARAHEFGANGMIGIHWRTRTIDHVASYFARALWQPGLDVTEFYRWYGERLVGTQRADAFAAQITHIDQSHAWPGYLDDDHVGSTAWSHGHSNEAGAAFNPLQTSPTVVETFGVFSDFLRELATETEDDAARERIQYHAAQVGFAEDYVQSQHAAAAIDALVATAMHESRCLHSAEQTAVNDHLQAIFSAVRRAIETFAATISTTADLGVLASLSLKYAQRAIWQRVDAVRQVTALPDDVPTPDLTLGASPSRVFVPVPPEVIAEGGALVEAIVQHPSIEAVTLRRQTLTGTALEDIPLVNRGRGVWTGLLTSNESVRYWIEARTGANVILRSPAASGLTHSAIVLENG